jgi:DNA-directed RNA polymerase III subunit RPC3
MDMVRFLNLPPRQIRTGLVVLVQHNLAFHWTNDRGQTFYRANMEQAYSVCFRTAKLARTAQKRFGQPASDVMIKLSTMGQATLPELETVFGFQNHIESTENTTYSSVNGSGNGSIANHHPTNGTGPNSGTKRLVSSVSQLHRVIDQLLRVGYLIKVVPHQYMTREDIELAAETVVKAGPKYADGGAKGVKAKKEFKRDVIELKRKWRNSAHDYSETIQDRARKRQRRLSSDDEMEDEDRFRIEVRLSIPRYLTLTDQDTFSVRINFEKTSVLLRNAQLVTLAYRYIGETTAKVLEAALLAHEGQSPRCWDHLEDEEQNLEDHSSSRDSLTAKHILNHLDPAVNPKDGLPPIVQSNGVNGHSNSIEEDEQNKLVLIGKHMDLLANDPRGFLFCLDRGITYTVPFRKLTRILIQNTIERQVTARFGRMAVRIIRLLVQHGTQDEKFLAQMGILKPKEIRALTNILLKSGLIDTQEVPRDANRTTNRILWLYAYNPRRARMQLLDEGYLAMRNLLRRAKLERAKFDSVLRKVERADVEEERLNESDKKQVADFKLREERLLAMLWRIDDLVACLGSEFLPMDDRGLGYQEQGVEGQTNDMEVDED